MQSIDEKIGLGQSALDQGDNQEAHRIFTEVVSENSEKWMAWRGLGFANIALGKTAEAIEAFGKATLIRTDDVDSQYGYGVAYQLNGDHAKAIKAFEESLRHNHKHKPSQEAICVSLLAQVQHMKDIGNLLAVEEYLEKAHKFDPENQDVTIQLFRYYQQTGQAVKLDTAITEMKRHEIPVPEAAEYAPVEEAAAAALPETISELEALTAANPNHWQAWRAIGNLQLDAGKPQAAHDAFKKATVIRPDDADSQYGFGRALQDLAEHSHAIHAFEEALRHDKNHPQAKKALTRSLMAYVDHMREIGNLLAVEQYLERAHKNDISDANVTAQLMGYYDETGQGGKKHAIIKDLEAHGLPVPEPAKPSEVGHMPSERAAEAAVEIDGVDALRAHLAANGEDWRNWRKLGFALLESGDNQGAHDAFKKATVVRIDDADSQYGFGLSLQRMNDHNHAIHAFEEALRHNPQHPDAKAALKTSYLGYCDHMREIGNLLAIEQFMEKAFKIDPSDHAVGQKLFDYYRETGQGSKAAKVGQEIGIVSAEEAAAANTPPDNTSDDLLLPQEKQYQREGEPEPAKTTATQQVSDIPAMLPCPGCKQLMPSRSRTCPHCSRLVDAIGGTILRGNESDKKKKPESASSAGKRSGCGGVMMALMLLSILAATAAATVR